MDDKQVYLFQRFDVPAKGVTSHSEMSYICPDEARWDDVVRQFATFLDTCGYVGVYERVDALLYDYWEKG